jgi:hypothetical protein
LVDSAEQQLKRSNEERIDIIDQFLQDEKKISSFLTKVPLATQSGF